MTFLTAFFFLLLTVLNIFALPQNVNERIAVDPLATPENTTKMRSESYHNRPKVTGIKEDAVAFPVEDTNKNRTATHNRQPLQDLLRCPSEGELLYPGDNEADWVCDCKPAYLYVPEDQKCYAAYTQGNCKNDDEILTSTDKSGNPHCVKNECAAGYVFFKNACYLLNKEDGCYEYKKLTGRKVFLVVNPSTLQLNCLDIEEKFICVDGCCRGTHEQLLGNCA